MTTLEHAGLEVEVVTKRVKRLTLRVYPPDGRVRLTAPVGTTRRDLERMIAEHAGWISDQQRRYRVHDAARPGWEAGELHFVRGVPLTLRYERPTDAAKNGITLQVDGAQLVASASTSTSVVELERALEALHRRVLTADLTPLAGKWEARLGVSDVRYSLKRMTSRWGSCTARTRRISLNLALAQRAPQLLEYVLVHELAHLFVQNHGPAFKALMSELLPDWRKRNAALSSWPLWAGAPLQAADPERPLREASGPAER